MVSSKVLALAALSATSALAAPSRGKFGCGAEPTPELLAAAEQMAVQEAAGNTSFNALATVEVDVYFHVVASSTAVADGYVADSSLTRQLSFMNSAYSPNGIHFNLAGTDRTVNSAWASDGAEIAMKKTLRKGDYSALNLYFLKSLGGNLGYCYFPAAVSSGSNAYYQDGCSILSSTVPGGSETGYNLGGTVVHEVGHWFGLFHTFQGSSCSGSGDSVADTPQQLSATSGCPTTRDSCPNVAGVDPIHNYMDYSTDVCYEEFTAGQKTRMLNMWSQYRG
ncbi:Uu.00g049010.m01.CDS01 [Anthostomella pinea]|uniref:Uu.00g049010.m01.CDS01 n=1 Tax=Anthostomella pinea TaxID=933095 RepID=A0AAI8VBX3_9PEZI|nr:Uu.00g049010.m01.CDS01 [Anthostomella pinea]